MRIEWEEDFNKNLPEPDWIGLIITFVIIFILLWLYKYQLPH